MQYMQYSDCIRIVLFCIADIMIWLGLYLLFAKGHIRNAKKKGKKADLKRVSIILVASCLISHSVFLWYCSNYMGVLL